MNRIHLANIETIVSKFVAEARSFRKSGELQREQQSWEHAIQLTEAAAVLDPKKQGITKHPGLTLGQYYDQLAICFEYQEKPDERNEAWMQSMRNYESGRWYQEALVIAKSLGDRKKMRFYAEHIACFDYAVNKFTEQAGFTT